MKLSELYKTEFSASFINCLRQYWKYDKKWSSLGKPKERELLLYFDGCSAKYTMRSGESFTARPGDIVYCPKGSKYSVEFFGLESEKSGTVGINFRLDAETSPGEPELFNLPPIASEISEIELLGRRDNTVIMKYNILLTQILIALGELSDADRTSDSGIIKCGVDHLQANLFSEVRIKDAAALSNVSEVYFRRLFREKFGISPSAYLIRERLAKASEYLRYTDNSVSEIAELTGFIDTSYFIRRFKKQFGETPLAYRNKFLIN